MRIFFDDNLKIIGVYNDDAEVSFVGAYEILCPFNIKTKLEKPVTITRQKHDETGKPMFVDVNGNATCLEHNKGALNTPVMESVTVTRKVGLQDAPNEWTLDDVFQAKYAGLAKGKAYWFNEFLTDSIVDRTSSIVNSGVFSLSVPPQGVAQLVPIQIANTVRTFELYVEGADGLVIKVSTDGAKTFSVVNAGAVTLQKDSDTFVFRFENPAEDGNAIPVDAIAIFY